MPTKKLVTTLVAAIILATTVFFASYLLNKPAIKNSIKSIVDDSKTPGAQASPFGTYDEVSVNINPQAPDYKIEADLSNLTNLSDFSWLSEQAKKMLAQNGFVVQAGYGDEFFPMYETNRYAQTPNFITTDSILHNYHLMFNYLLEKLEKEKLAAELKKLNLAMLVATNEQFNLLQDSDWSNAAKRAAGFFAVGSKLLDAGSAVPPYVKNEVAEELALIEAHQGIVASPLINLGAGPDIILDTPQGPLPLEALKEDYSQYIPRGHYDKSDLLKAYFKSMMWYGRLTFRFKNEDEIKSAVLITLALAQGDNKKSWDKIYEPTNFFVGKSDDISYYQLKQIIDKVYGEQAELTAIVNDKAKFAQLVEETKKLEPPQINSMPVFNADIQPDREKEILGFRFMGQRYTIDAAIFQRLVAREVGPKGETCAKAPFASGRMLPKGLDIPAAFGSNEALNVLKNQGETQYACYQENMSKMQSYVANLPKEIWTQNLYWGWMYTLLPLTLEKTGGYPLFMKSLAWTRKQLNTFLANWTELKHDTILYAKQVYAELGGGGDQEKKDDRGYVEPEPYVYARLASLLKMTSEGLADRGLLSGQDKENLGKMEELALKLKTISEKELNNQPLEESEYELIRSYGGQLEHFWLEINKEDIEKSGVGQRNFLDDNPAALVTDVATDPNGEVLEEATGHINNIFVVVPVSGKLKIAKGGVFSYYEFKWPMSDRLTDTKWREILSGVLSSVKPPEVPAWAKEFMAGQ